MQPVPLVVSNETNASDPRGGDVAQLVEHPTGTPLTQVRFPGAGRDFSLRVNFQYRLSYGARSSPGATTCINISALVKDPVAPCQSAMDCGNTKTPRMHGRLGSATLSHLAFPGEWQPKFSMGEIPLGQYSRKKFFCVCEFKVKT